MHTAGAVHEPGELVADAGPPGGGHVLDVPGELNPQKYGMDAVADVSDGGESEANAHEGVQP
jgi:hypothetical protein